MLQGNAATRFRLLHGRTLTSLTQTIIDPAISSAVKEHMLTAADGLAGNPPGEYSFPQLLGLFCSARLPGTQREAMGCLQLMAEKVEGSAARLGQLEEVKQGLTAAAASADAQVAAEAGSLLQLFGLR